MSQLLIVIENFRQIQFRVFVDNERYNCGRDDPQCIRNDAEKLVSALLKMKA
jgi:hypothetical protein